MFSRSVRTSLMFESARSFFEWRGMIGEEFQAAGKHFYEEI